MMIGQFLGKSARIKTTANCESYWNNHHDRRGDCIALRDQQVIGTISQAGDDGWCFVTFNGHDGHWFPPGDLDIDD